MFRDILGALTADIPVLLSNHDLADLAKESAHVTVLEDGRVIYHGTTAGFLAHAPADVIAGRAAEAAYTALSQDGRRL
ncbi:hypothetical protein [Streptomyces mayteni]